MAEKSKARTMLDGGGKDERELLERDSQLGDFRMVEEDYKWGMHASAGQQR